MQSQGSHDDNAQLSSAFSKCDVATILNLLQDECNFVDINYRDRSQGLLTYPMRLCHCRIGSDDARGILELLVEYGADLNTCDAVGKTVLCHACIAQRVDLLSIICTNGHSCDPNIVDHEGNTAIFYAVRSGNEQVLRTFLRGYAAKVVNLRQMNKKGMWILS